MRRFLLLAVHLFDALKDPLPEHGDIRRQPLLLLRIECWLRIVSIGISLLMLIFMPFVIDFLLNQMGDEGADGPMVRNVMVVAMLVGGIFGLIIALGWHVWINWLAGVIKEQKPSAENGLFAYGIVVAIFSGFSLIVGLFNLILTVATGQLGSSIFQMIGLPQSIALLVFGILYAVVSRKPEFAASVNGDAA